MTNPEFLLALALAESQKAKKEVAIVADDRLHILALATGAASGCETAIANVLHGSQGRLDGWWVLATYTPTPLCLGMANILGISSVGFLDSARTARDAATTQNIVRLNKLPVKDFSIFSTQPKTNLPDWKVSPERFLEAANTEFFSSLGPAYQGALKFLSSCPRYDQRNLDSKLLNIFKQVPTTLPATTLSSQERDFIFMHLAFALVGQTWNPVVSWDVKDSSGEKFGGNNVGAVILDKNNIIAWGVNLAAQNPVLHAESVAILSYLKGNNKQSLPDGATVYTSLEPCKMCAGMITGAGKNVEIVIGAKDHLINTVISDSKTYNGCFERVPDPGLSKNPFTVVESWIDGRRQRSVEDSRLDLSSAGGGGASTKFLRDEEDSEYRDPLRSKPKFAPESAKRLATVQATMKDWDQKDKQYKKTHQYPTKIDTEMKTLQKKKSEVEAKFAALQKKYGSGNFGKKFSSYADALVLEWKKLKSEPDSDKRRAYQQCIELLKIVAVEGLTTNYGMNFVNTLFSDFA